jgi:GntP family gluconate:H+ symporter
LNNTNSIPAALPVVTTLPPALLLLATLLVVIGLILLITRWRMPAFIALLIASLVLGACAGLNVAQICKAFQEGVGAVLGPIVIIIGLGAVLGKLLAESGGAQQIADRLLRLFGPRHLPWAMLLLGFVVGIPTFFTVGLILLAPILFAVREKSDLPFLHIAIPMLAGLSAAHGFVPPHPGPMVAVGILNADMGKTIFYSLLIGAGAAVLSGPVLRCVCAAWNEIRPASVLGKQFASVGNPAKPPAFWPTLITILLPVILIMAATGAELIFAPGHPIRRIATALGTPLGAMLIAVLIAFWLFGTARGFDRKTILKFAEDCVAPVAVIVLVVGAGGGFNKVLVVSGVGDAIAEFARNIRVSPLIFGWLVAAAIRVATGSATVAVTTAAGIVAPVAATTPGVNVELLVIAMGAGSLILSHVNDAGFWFVKEYLGLSATETLKSWTVMETVLAVTGLVLTLLADQILR